MSTSTDTTDFYNAVTRGGGNSVEFQRWLDRVKADAWELGWLSGYNDGQDAADDTFAPGPPTTNPYRRNL